MTKSRNKFDKLTKTFCTYQLTLTLQDRSGKLQSQDIRAVLLQENLLSYCTCCCQPEIFIKFIFKQSIKYSITMSFSGTSDVSLIKKYTLVNKQS